MLYLPEVSKLADERDLFLHMKKMGETEGMFIYTHVMAAFCS